MGSLSQTFVQNRLDGSPPRAGMCQRPFACGPQPGFSHFALKPDNPLRGTHID
jgi:hypothetical protein